MAELIDFGGDVDSHIVQGLGTNSVTFKMPATRGLAVESVLATINNTAGGDTTGLLTVTDQSGEVIAKKRQSEVVDAGATTTATWALRLDDKTLVPVFQKLERFNTNAVSVAPAATVFATWVKFAGDTLLDLANPQSGVLLASGQYAFSVTAHVFPSPAVGITGYYSVGFDLTGSMDHGLAAPKGAADNRIWPGASTDSYVSLAGTWRVEAGATLTMSIQSNLSGTVFFEYVANLQKL